MFVAVVSTRERLERPKYGIVVSDQFDEADPATSWGWRASRFASVKPQIEKAGRHDGPQLAADSTYGSTSKTNLETSLSIEDPYARRAFGNHHIIQPFDIQTTV
jgi:hypothetical protein